MEDREFEVGQKDIRKMIRSRLQQSSITAVSELELDLMSNLILAVLTSSGDLSEETLPKELSFDPKLRIGVRKRLLDLLIAAVIGAFTGSMVESIGPKTGIVAALSAYAINIIPELRAWISKYNGLSESKERLILNFIKTAAPVKKASIIEYAKSLDVSRQECEYMLRELTEQKLIQKHRGRIQVSLSEEATQVLCHIDLNRGQKRNADCLDHRD